ncbi:Swt1 family HEPN domain-containing protein [Halobacteriovorax sp.]|uniref:Swt1 family HEPN domain-containing protein n=1 Tax=Halobacteriovorax sp. TaxID=2020862 RepID=UPI003563260F
MNNINKKLKEFVFKGLLLEADSKKFREAGYRIGIDFERNEEKLLFEEIEPFNIQTRNNSIRMARLYALLHCFENQVRDLIRDTLSEVDPNWSTNLIPKKVSDHANKRIDGSEKNSWLEGEPIDLLGYVDFGHLSDVILNQWTHFEALIPSQHWLKQRMDELEKTRNYIAHNRMLLDSEFERIYMYIRDWNKQIGL